jgi:hypothetical protein
VSLAPFDPNKRGIIQSGIDSAFVIAHSALAFSYEARYWLIDVLPILTKARAKQAARNLVDVVPFLSLRERQEIRAWLKRHGC